MISHYYTRPMTFTVIIIIIIIIILLSHLLLAKCDIGVQLSVRPSTICVESRKFTSSLGINFISLQQWSLTHSSSRHLDPVPLTFISRSSDFVNILRRVWKIYVESRNKVHFSAAVVAVKMKPCIVIVLDTPFKQAP